MHSKKFIPFIQNNALLITEARTFFVFRAYSCSSVELMFI